MTTVFQPNAFQSNAVQIDGGVAGADVTASIAWQQENATWSVNGAVTASATISWTADDASWAVAGLVGNAVTAAIAWTQDAQSWSVDGAVGVAGTVAWTAADATWAATGSVSVAGPIAWTADDATWAITGISAQPATADIAWSQESQSWSVTGTSDAQTGGFGGANEYHPWNDPKNLAKWRRQNQPEERPLDIAASVPLAMPTEPAGKAASVSLATLIEQPVPEPTTETTDDDIIAILLMAA